MWPKFKTQMRIGVVAVLTLLGVALGLRDVVSQPINPGVQQIPPTPANNDCVKWVIVSGAVRGITGTGAACSPATAAANPTATAGPVAVNGIAATYMRSDGAPAVQKGTDTLFGLVHGDGTTVSCAATAGVCIVAGIVVGGQTITPGGSAAVQGNGAKIQLSTGTATSGDCVKFDANGNTVANGAACPTQSSGANPSATASDVAVNGVAMTYMRSDGAPAVQKGTNAAFGVVQGNGTTITCVAGVCGTIINGILPTPTRAGDIIYWNGSAWVALAGNNSGTNVLTENSSGVPSWAAPGTGTVTSAVVAGTAGNISVSGTCTITTTGTCTIDLSAGRKTLPTTQIFNTGTSATYTTPANVLWLEVYIWGGGAGSGGNAATSGAQVSASGGGGGGAFCYALLNTPSATYTYTVGPAGAAGSSGANDGGNGGQSSFSTSTAPGGSGGKAGSVSSAGSSSNGGAGGVPGANCTSTAGGSDGTPSIALFGSYAIGGNGGMAALGGGGGMGKNVASGNAGQAPGGGSGGVSSNAGAGATPGLAGIGGRIMVIEHYNFLLRRDIMPSAANDNVPLFLNLAA